VTWLAERGWNGNRVSLAFLGMLPSNAVCLLFGAAWLAVLIGHERAIMLGAMPFLVGAVVLKLLARGRTRALERPTDFDRIICLPADLRCKTCWWAGMPAVHCVANHGLAMIRATETVMRNGNVRADGIPRSSLAPARSVGTR
jgi:BioY family protein